MRLDIHNLSELCDGLEHYAEVGDEDEPVILVLHTAGNQAFRFIVNRYGMEREQCTNKGDSME